MRSILLVSRELKAHGAALNKQGTDFVPVERDAHPEIREELELYGRIDRAHTSGILPRVKTPPEGIDINTIYSDPHSHPSTMEALERKREESRHFFRTIFPRINDSDVLVVVRDGYSDTRGALVMHAHSLGKPILALQRISRHAEPPYEALYDLLRVTNVRFEHFEEARLPIRRFFNSIPVSRTG